MPNFNQLIYHISMISILDDIVLNEYIENNTKGSVIYKKFFHFICFDSFSDIRME